MRYETLIDYAASDLGEPEAAAVEAWVARDPSAARVVKLFRLAQASLRVDEVPPAEAAARARAIFERCRSARPARSDGPGFAEALAGLVARLIFDSRAQPALAGLRGHGSGVQLTYELDRGPANERSELDLQAEPAPASRAWRVVGQVAGGARCDAMRVDLCPAGSPTPVRTVLGDRRGAFALSVEPGTYDLHLHLPEGVAIVPDIRIW
jgi:hypothetical protein